MDDNFPGGLGIGRVIMVTIRARVIEGKVARGPGIKMKIKNTIVAGYRMIIQSRVFPGDRSAGRDGNRVRDIGPTY